MTATFLSLLMRVSWILRDHGCSGLCGLEMDNPIRMQKAAKMTFSYPLAL